MESAKTYLVAYAIPLEDLESKNSEIQKQSRAVIKRESGTSQWPSSEALLGDLDAAISDLTRAPCLSSPANSHRKSPWRRSQAFDIKGLAQVSLMDCVIFLNGCIKTDTAEGVKIQYHDLKIII
ncbi:hypothetical protein POTOM_047536 [Populus tomentosa]|uniref:Uncharacterized protein n=1 Tax=Populus tomentosa TaxID=118781 RepID=A0A8X7YBB1_POPTO|nr:hypothetical protein POTOM_047536 [Populus tomentosa]